MEHGIILRNLTRYVVLSVLLWSCQPRMTSDTDSPLHGEVPLFKKVPAEHSGITFANNLPETDFMNAFLYEYFYNGAGVAVGDFNKDGLDDLYFTSNLEDNKLYLNQGGWVFKDVTEVSGVAGKKGWSTGVSVVDINEDGWMDIYVCQSGAFTEEEFRRNQLFIHQGLDENGYPIFNELAAKYGLDDPSYSMHSAFFDYDRDGDLDLFLANHNPEAPPRGIQQVVEWHETASPYGGNKMYRNDGGRFTDVTSLAGIVTNRMNYTLGLSVSDINNDGWPDVYVANDYSEPDYLYINNSKGGFINVAPQSFGHIPNFSMGSDIGDINNDGLLDIMSLDMAAVDNFGIKTSMSGMDPALFHGHVEAGLHRQYMYNALQLNMGSTQEGLTLFSDIGQLAGVASTDWSWAPLLADLDNDGYKDLFVTNGVKRDFINNDFNILLNNEIQKVHDLQQDPLNFFAQWTQLAPRREKVNYLFKNKGDLTFEDVSKHWGLKENSLSNGAAYSDLDNDGDLDLIVNNIDAPADLLENTSENTSNGYLSVSLEGPAINQYGIGARVEVTTGGSTQIQEQYPVRGYLSAVSHKLHFGLGSRQEAEIVTVRWPDGAIQELKNIQANRHLVVNYQDARPHSPGKSPPPPSKLFRDISSQINLPFRHQENPFDDFARESLLPHKMSQQGPALAVADVNGDGLEDFYIGGAIGRAGQLFLQDVNGRFYPTQKKFWEGDKNYEDTDALFLDPDGDGDMDLFVVSGGNEYPEGSNYYRVRVYENLGGGNFSRSLSQNQMPVVSASVIRQADFDNDGDPDLFIGGRQKPARYPFPVSSYLLRNDGNTGTIKFTNVSMDVIPDLENLGMVTDALWTDLDGDGRTDLVTCGEWMGIRIFKNTTGRFEDISANTGVGKHVGWWNALASADFDGDGDMDLVAGNHGLNNKYRASDQEPFQVYTADFDDNGSFDIVLGYYNGGELFPLRGRECTSNQMPFVKSKFTTYEAFGKATLLEVYGSEKLSGSLHYQVNSFATTYFENQGDLSFVPYPLENLAQVSSVKSLLVHDFDRDGQLDLLLSGNHYESEVETPRNDASYGLFLRGNGKGRFNALLPQVSGLYVIGEVKKSAILTLANGDRCLLFAKNDAPPSFIKVNMEWTP